MSRAYALGVLLKSLGSPLSGPPPVMRDTHTDRPLPLFMGPRAGPGEGIPLPESPLKLSKGQHQGGPSVCITAGSHSPGSVFLSPFCRRGKGSPAKQSHEPEFTRPVSGGAGVQARLCSPCHRGPTGTALCTSAAPEHVPEHTPPPAAWERRALLSEPGPSPRPTRATGCNPGGVTGLQAQKGAPPLGSKLCRCHPNNFISGLVIWK